MKKISIACLAFAASMFSAAAFSATGEYWEVTSKMEMPGMPFAMPATTSKVCIPKGGESDPQRTQDKDTKCTFTDVQHAGNTVKYKGTCTNSRGDTMNMTGETTHDSSSFKTKMEMSAEGGKHDKSMTMAMTSSGKRIGGSCDAEEITKKTQAQAQEQSKQYEKMQKDVVTKACDISDSNKLFTSVAYYAGSSPLCSNKKEYCNAVREKAQRDTGFFRDMVSQEKMRKKYASQGVKKTEEVSVINICNLDMASLNKTVCKNSAHQGPQDFMDENCSPAEAKEYREFVRKQQDCKGRGYISGEKMERCMAGMLTKEDAKEEDCRGRGYTSEELKNCMGGAMPKEVAGSDSANADAGKAKANKSKADEEQKTSEKPAKENNPADAVLEGAKKLKGFLRF